MCKKSWIFVFAKNIGKNISKILSSKYSQKLLDLNRQQQMDLKLLQKESFKKQHKQTVI